MVTVRGGTVIDGTGSDPRPADVVVDGDRIKAVAPGGRGQPGAPAGGDTLEADGLYVLPGLIDLHTHFGILDPLGHTPLPPALAAARLFENAELCLQSGHTTAREVGGADGGLKQVIDAGLIAGPRLFPSGPLISQTGGHGDSRLPFIDHVHVHGLPGLTQPTAVCDGPENVRRAARLAFRHGATQLKLCVSGGIVSIGDVVSHPQFTVEELRAAVEEAHAHDTYVTAHAHNSAGIRLGLEAGLECFEHATMLDEETAQLMAARGAAMVPTLSILRLLFTEHEKWGIPPELLKKAEGLVERMAESIRMAAAAGVTIGSGTDLLGIQQNPRGLEVAVRAEVDSPMASIVAATSTNAKILRRPDLGVVAPGNVADLIAIDFDPLAEPDGFADPDRVVLVIKDGVVAKDCR